MKSITDSPKRLVELWGVSIIAGFFFSMVSNGGLCMLLLNGEGLWHRTVLAFILAFAFWSVTESVRVLIERTSYVRLVSDIRDITYILLNTKTVLFAYLLAVSSLTHAVFYPFYAEKKIYFVSYFLFFAFLIVAALSYVTKHDKFQKAVTSSLIVCALGFCIGRLLPEWHFVYDVFYYCVLLMNLYFVMRIMQGVTAIDSYRKITSWILRNKGNIFICLLATMLGGCAEVAYKHFNNVQFMFPRCVFWAAVGFCLAAFVILYRKKECFVERAFLYIVLAVGIYMAVFMPLTTNVSWDDQIHYANTLDWVQGENRTGADWSMIAIEKGIRERLISEEGFKDYFRLLAEKKHEFLGRINAGGDILFHQKIGYIPNMIGLCIGQTLNLSYGITFILGRVSGVICYALIMYAAMKRLSSGKLLVATVALIPTNVFQAANYTYDAWIVCFVVLAISIFISYLQNEAKQIYAKDMLMPLMILVLAIAPKGIYFPLFLLFVLIPSAKFVDNNQYKTYVKNVFGAMIVCFIMYMLLPFLGGKNQGDLRFGTEVSAVGQIIHILKNPVIYIRNLFGFLKGYLSLENSFDYTFFWAYLTFNRVDYHATMMVLLFVTAVIDHGSCDNAYCTGMVKLTTTALIYVIAAMIATVLYLTCSPVGADVINGCQPRYLAPLVFPFLMLVCNLGAFQLKHKCAMQAVILTISGYVLFVLVWSNIAGQYIV